MNERTNGHWYKYNYCLLLIQGRRFFCHIHRNTYVKHVVKFCLVVSFVCASVKKKIARGTIKCSVCTAHVQVWKKVIAVYIVIVCVQDTECLRKEAPPQSLCSGLVAAEKIGRAH